MESKKTKLNFDDGDNFFVSRKKNKTTKKTVLKENKVVLELTDENIVSFNSENVIEQNQGSFFFENDSLEKNFETFGESSSEPIFTSNDSNPLDTFEFENFKQSPIYLYDGCNLSVRDASFLINCFISKYSLSKKAQKDLLNLIHFFLPTKNLLPKNIEKINKQNSIKDAEITEVFYCRSCSGLLNEHKECNNCEFDTISKNRDDYDVFSYVDFSKSLTHLCNLYSNQILSFNKSRRDYYDIVDADHYKKKANNHINLILYTDGIQVSKSSSKNFWPVIVSICELPPIIRNSIKNKIVIGVWYGQKKPTSDILFKHFVENFKKINENGVKISLNGKLINLKVGLYGVICDTPAKAMVLNMNQFNGNCGCPYCLNPGKFNIKYKKMIYLQKDFEKRTDESYKIHSLNGTFDKPVCGIKGKVFLSDILELPDSFPIDYMHLVCLGIFKRLLKCWFDTSYKNQKFYLGNKTKKKMIQNEIKKFKYPHDIKRTNFDINSYNTWKANEIRVFFFHMSLRVLKNILPETFYTNLCCLIFALKILHQCQSVDDLTKAESLLNIFSKWFVNYYGKEQLTFTFHCLSKHLVENVRLHGSLSGHSMFSVESCLGYFRRRLNGTRGYDRQFIQNSISYININSKINFAQSGFENFDAFKFCKKLLDQEYHTEKIELLSPIVKRELNLFEKEQLEIAPNEYSQKMNTSLRLYFRGSIFHSSSYKRVGESKCSYFIRYKIDDNFHFGEISYFLKIEEFYFVAIYPFKIISESILNDIKVRLPKALEDIKKSGFFNKIYFECEKSRELILINPYNIINKCIIYKISETRFFVSNFILENEHD